MWSPQAQAGHSANSVVPVSAGHGALLDCIAELAIVKHAAVGSSAALRKRRGAECEGLCMTGGP